MTRDEFIAESIAAGLTREELLAKRISFGMTQEALAEAMCFENSNTISHKETGVRGITRRDIRALANIEYSLGEQDHETIDTERA